MDGTKSTTHRATDKLSTIQSQQLHSTLRHPEKHRCSICQVPLKNLTKIITIYKSDYVHAQQSQALRIVCVPCFAGWSTSKMDKNQLIKADYKIWICRSLNKKIEFDQSLEMTISECLQILSCAQKYGPHVNSQFHSQFCNSTGTNLPQSEIESRYFKLRRCLLDSQSDLSFQHPQEMVRNIEASEIIQIPRPINIVQDVSVNRYEQIDEAQLFFNLLQYRNPVERLRKYPDNHSDYLFRAFTTNHISKQLICADSNRKLDQINQKTTLLFCVTQYAAQKNQTQKRHLSLNKKYCQKYIQMKRAAKAEIPIQDTDSKLLHNLTHPQVSKLMNDQQLNAMLTSIVRLNKERSEILSEVREKKKSLDNLRRSERRQNKKLNKSIQSQSKQQVQQDEKYLRAEQFQESQFDN